MINPKIFAAQIVIVIVFAVGFHFLLDYLQETPAFSNSQEEEPNIIKDEMASRANISTNPSHYVKTLGGISMPKLIYGTAWKKEKTADLVVEAVRAGFRGVDTACQPQYYHEPGVGEAIKRLIEEDMRREDLFIQTKFSPLDDQDLTKEIPYDKNAPLLTQVEQSLEASLKNLGTTYIDSLVMHTPLRTMDQILQVWKTFESFVDKGKVHQLGVSNFYNYEDFKNIFDSARIKPAVLQNRLYKDSNFDKKLRKFCQDNGIFYQSFWTLTANPQILNSKEVQAMSTKYGKTPAQMFFAYLVQTGVVTPLTGTKNKAHMQQDLEVLDMNPLTPEEKGAFDSFIN